MEDGLRDDLFWLLRQGSVVLILVLVEDGLRELQKSIDVIRQKVVLILVLVEDGLRE